MKTHLTINDPSPRFLLVPEVMPKEILPIMDNSMIHYAVGDDDEAGITKMIFVSVQTQRVIEDHFANHPELKCKLDKKNTAARNSVFHHFEGCLLHQHSAARSGTGSCLLCA